MKRISPQDAKQLMDEGWSYLDVRSTQEFDNGHPQGAWNVPFMHAGAGGMTPNPDFLRVVQAVFPKDARLVVGCMSGGRSLRAAELLAQHGFTQLVDQRCGFGGSRSPSGEVEAGWAASQLPVETGSHDERSYPQLLQRAG